MATSEEDARQVALAGEKQGSRKIETDGVRLSDDEVEAILDGFEKEDDSEKTWTRRLVENHLMHVSCANMAIALSPVLYPTLFCLSVHLIAVLFLPSLSLFSMSGISLVKMCQELPL
jgi:Flp pilus assembly protein TadB